MSKSLILLLSLIAASGSSMNEAFAQDPVDNPAQAAAPARPCAAAAHATNSANSAPNSAKSNAISALQIPAGCLEVQAAPQAIQDFLRSMTRKQKWRIAQEQTSADTWSFVRYLDAEELQRFARADILAGHIVWREGKAAVQVKTSDAENGFTRVQVTAKFQGKGESKEPLARPTDIWPLVSRGTLEGGMIAALQSHFNSQR